MDEVMGSLIIERACDAVDEWQVCQIAWTTAQLRRIGRAVKEDDQAFLSSVEQAMRLALEAALTPQRG